MSYTLAVLRTTYRSRIFCVVHWYSINIHCHPQTSAIGPKRRHPSRALRVSDIRVVAPAAKLPSVSSFKRPVSSSVRPFVHVRLSQCHPSAIGRNRIALSALSLSLVAAISRVSFNFSFIHRRNPLLPCPTNITVIRSP